MSVDFSHGILAKDRIVLMFEKIELNSETILVELTRLTDAVNHLRDEVALLKVDTSSHKKQLQSIGNAVDWTVRYGLKVITVIFACAIFYESIKKAIPKLG